MSGTLPHVAHRDSVVGLGWLGDKGGLSEDAPGRG